MCDSTFALDMSPSTPFARLGGTAAARVPAPNFSGPRTRGSRFPCQPRMQTRSRPVAGKKRSSPATPYSRIRHPQPRRNRRPFGGVQRRVVDLAPTRASTTGSFWPSMAALLTERKASQSLPALRAPVLNRKQLSPLRRQPRGLFRRACARGLAGMHCRAFLKRAAAFDLSVGTRCRADVPAFP